MSTFFISDLHLCSEQPGITQLFLNFLRQQAMDAEALYILGDLFETWIGDDDINPYNRTIVAALAELTASGIACYFMPGNRDFLIGKRFTQQTGCQYLADPTVINLYGNSTLLTHGDRFCSLDTVYQRYRRWSRHPFWQSLFLRLSTAWRQKIAHYLRGQDHANLAMAMAAKYDVVLSDLLACLTEYPGTQQIIHGHTHLPSIELIKNKDNSWIQRFVLSDWNPKLGNVLIATPDQNFSLVYFS